LREAAEGLRGQVVDVELETSSLEVEGDLAIETGTNKLKIGNTPPLKGHSLVLWKKAQGKWKIHREMWNFSTSHEEGLLKITTGDESGAPGGK
jgi:ketosteroid isomerase-like protein